MSLQSFAISQAGYTFEVNVTNTKMYITIKMPDNSLKVMPFKIEIEKKGEDGEAEKAYVHFHEDGGEDGDDNDSEANGGEDGDDNDSEANGGEDDNDSEANGGEDGDDNDSEANGDEVESLPREEGGDDDPSPSKEGFTAFYPIVNRRIYNLYAMQRAMHWVPSEIGVSVKDSDDWQKINDQNPQVTRLLEFVLAFFAQFDDIVATTINDTFVHEVSYFIKEAKPYYSSQEEIENVHAEVYSILIELYIKDPAKREKMLNSIRTYPIIGEMADWMREHVSDKYSLPHRIVAMAAVEGIMFQSAFAVIYYIRSMRIDGDGKICPALVNANKLIARDEALHVTAASEIYKIMKNEHDMVPMNQTRFEKIIKDVVELTCKFMKNGLNVDLIDLKFGDMVSYIQSVADMICKMFGYEKIYKIENRLMYMAQIGIAEKVNFFEDSVNEYAKQIKAEAFKIDKDLSF